MAGFLSINDNNYHKRINTWLICSTCMPPAYHGEHLDVLARF